MRSRTGCLTCRQRKLKCDEKTPLCGNCTRSSRKCIPSAGIVFRHNHNASMNGDDSGDEKSMKSFYSYKDTFESDAVWLDIPGQITFIHTTNPYLDSPDLDTMSITSLDSPAPITSCTSTSWHKHNYFASVTSRPPSEEIETVSTSIPTCTAELLAVSNSMQSPSISTIEIPVLPITSYCDHHALTATAYSITSTPPQNDLRFISPLNLSGDTRSRSNSLSGSHYSSPLPTSQPMPEGDHELAFLLHYFSEGPACWMDLFDLGTYFAAYIPVKAQENPLLKYAAIACAAKALAGVQGRQPDIGESMTLQPWTEMYPAVKSIAWKHKAAVFYDKAVTLLLHALKTDVTITVDESSSEFRNHNWDPAHGYDTQAPNRCRAPGSPPIVSSNDDILAASAILCFYEFLDTSVAEWAKHLNGAKSLFVLTQVQIQPFQSLTLCSPMASTRNIVVSKARKATFWNIARQDMLAAFINKSPTRLDTEDTSLWKEAGLLIDDQGSIMLNNTYETGYPEEYEAMIREDTICNGLVWLMAKLVNFIATCDQISNDTGLLWIGSTQQTLSDCWCSLRKQFQVWHDALPATFQPAVRMDPQYRSNDISNSDYDRNFAKIWHSSPMRASTIQMYHMGQVLLFMNRPQESALGRNMVCTRLKSYQSVLDTCQKHSREIVSISLAEAGKAVRIHSVQPLFVAGQCISDSRERQVVLKLLHNIESDIGWCTEYRVQQLVQQWQWEQEDAQIP